MPLSTILKTEATKGAKGICQNCGSELIAKCGDVKVNHWAHKGTRNCDPWWENETEWHRTWKGNFSTEWQEIVLADEITGEKHIADVRTTHGFVIEFQHSHIHPNERTKREGFYKKMVWVIDGTRLKGDYPRFLKRIGDFRLTKMKGVYLVNSPEQCFPSAWLGSSVSVIFDFRGTETIKDPRDYRNNLYCLYPKPDEIGSVVAVLPRQWFIDSIISGKLFTQKQDQQKQVGPPPIKSVPTIPQRQSQYVYDRGRLVKRRRW